MIFLGDLNVTTWVLIMKGTGKGVQGQDHELRGAGCPCKLAAKDKETDPPQSLQQPHRYFNRVISAHGDWFRVPLQITREEFGIVLS